MPKTVNKIDRPSKYLINTRRSEILFALVIGLIFFFGMFGLLVLITIYDEASTANIVLGFLAVFLGALLCISFAVNNINPRLKRKTPDRQA